MLFDDGIEYTVQFEAFSNDVAVGDPVSTWRGIRDFFDELDRYQKVGVGSNRLSGDASVRREFRFVELPFDGDRGVYQRGSGQRRAA